MTLTDRQARDALALLSRLARGLAPPSDADDLAGDALVELLSDPAPSPGELARACGRALRRVNARRRRRARREADHREEVALSLEGRERERRARSEERADAADAVREALSRVELSDVDVEIIAAVMRGERRSDVARRLGVSRWTVWFHLRSILDRISESVDLGVV